MDNRSGFTLLELLIVVSISGLVMAIGSSTFVAVADAWNERKTVAELDAQADLALESIRRDVTDALSAEISGWTVRGSSNTVSDTRTYPPAQHEDDDLLIPIRAIDPNRTLAVPANVGYRVERNGETGVLVRTIGPLGEEFPTTNRTELMTNVRVEGFSVEFLSPDPGSFWVDEWSDSRPPAAVRVSVSVEDADRPNEFQITRQLVAAVRTR
jgi:prepilin-type N-terminal cleavage/methylation domain-containing protein